MKLDRFLQSCYLPPTTEIRKFRTKRGRGLGTQVQGCIRQPRVPDMIADQATAALDPGRHAVPIRRRFVAWALASRAASGDWRTQEQGRRCRFMCLALIDGSFSARQWMCVRVTWANGPCRGDGEIDDGLAFCFCAELLNYYVLEYVYRFSLYNT